MTRPRDLARLALAWSIAAGTSLLPAASPQDRPDRPPYAQKSRPAPDQDRTRIRAEVNLVSVLVSVTDSHHRPAPDLAPDLFSVDEEGVAQKIEFFEPETQLPLDLVLMVDSSLSALKEMSNEQEAAAHFIRQVLRPGDRLAVYEFAENVTRLADFSDNVPQLQAAVRHIAPGAGTSIYDAVLLGARALNRRGSEHRRVIVLVTDAGETTSRSDFDSARKQAILSEALLYTIVIRSIKGESGRNTAGEHALETITDSTGGAVFYPNSPQELDAIFDRVDRELRTQYRLSYYPHPRGPANTFRKIAVRVQGDYEVRHRKGYFTAPE
ncbi:MAG TPA: VWA domain-containing protein [Methylomirabilota bacterium]|nr:VWA domain-containing protein [Methylomirabilota bacterium]